MSYRTIVKLERDALSFAETTIAQAMVKISEQSVSSMLGRIRKAISARALEELQTREHAEAQMSADFKSVQALDNRTVARFFATTGIVPEAYISRDMSDAEWCRRTGQDIASRTVSLKGYKKTKEAAEYFAHNQHLEFVLKAFVACSIVSAQSAVVIPRNVCERFLNSKDLMNDNAELQSVRAKHMTTGASTQTSQCTLQLATMKSAFIVRNGRYKDYVLDLDSPVVESFAQRFDLTTQLERARSFRQQITA